ncbi:MAG: type II toxin-antitoxin system RelE/ParE family toxin [Candidatus Lustribacter sp.]
MLDVVLPDAKTPSTPLKRSTQSKRLPAEHGGSATLDDRGWDVRLKRAVIVDVQRWGLDNPDFVPTLAELLEALRSNPYQFPEKRGGLVGARAADLTFRGQTWRLVYDVDDYAREVYVLALGKHDDAYDDAERRRYR